MKYADIYGNTVTYSAQHEFWIIDDNSGGFWTVRASKDSILMAHPPKQHWK